LSSLESELPEPLLDPTDGVQAARPLGANPRTQLAKDSAGVSATRQFRLHGCPFPTWRGVNQSVWQEGFAQPPWAVHQDVARRVEPLEEGLYFPVSPVTLVGVSGHGTFLCANSNTTMLFCNASVLNPLCFDSSAQSMREAPSPSYASPVNRQQAFCKLTKSDV
jgi:hypothetical protein